MTLLLISLAGGVGAIARFMTDGLIRTAFGRRFPWGTLTINIVGSFVLGLVTGLVISHHASIDARLIIGTGFCGGFTTFSTASFETVRLIEEKRFGTALLHGLGIMGLALGFAALGIWLTM